MSLMKTRSAKLKRWGVVFLLLSVPALLLRVMFYLTQTPLRYDNPLLVTVGALAMLGTAVGFGLLALDVLIGDKRSAK